MTSTLDRLKCLLSPDRYTVCMCVTVCGAVFICSDVQRCTDYRSVPVDERKLLFVLNVGQLRVHFSSALCFTPTFNLLFMFGCLCKSI